MADDHESTADDSGADVGNDLEAERTTAPMSEFPIRNAGIGALVLVVGLAVGYGVPLLAL